MKTIILAGGSGVRLWPLSRELYPKQFIKFQGKEKSLFQETFERALLVSSLEDIYIVTNINYKFLVMGAIEELGYNYSEDKILLEPVSKNTLPAIYAGVNQIVKNGNDNILVFPSDHVIMQNDKFITAIKNSEKLSNDLIVLFGVKPDKPNTGYGYIEPGIKLENGFHVDSFKEKPTEELALEYLEKGYLWNSGIFMFNSKVFIQQVKEFCPEIYYAFEGKVNIDIAFSKINKSISMDYGILEKSNKKAVVPVSIGWDDLGSFDSFRNIFKQDENKNISSKDNILIESSNNLIHTFEGKLVAAIGIEDLIIVDNDDALLVCNKDKSQAVKDVVEILNIRKDARSKYHLEDFRPWGQYRVLDEVKNSYKIKKLELNRGKSISYQLHHHRSEHWVIVKGRAQVTIEGTPLIAGRGESIFVKAGLKHKIENIGEDILEIIEVQMGDYLEEDDIIRFDSQTR